MEIIKVHPQGFCKGVINAIQMTNNALINARKPIYMLGSIVHNKHIANAYNSLGIITINDLSEIKDNNGSLIITAHGISKKKFSDIKKLNIDVVDTTCQCVSEIQKLVFNMIKQEYTVLYYGKKNHAECLGILEDYENSSHFILIQSIDDIDKLSITNDKIFFTNQTTMSYFDTLDIIDKLKEKYPNIIIKEDICNATKRRQLAFIDAAKKSDFSIVVGDKFSNNTLSLVSICNQYANKKCALIENIDDLKNIDFSHYNSISITSGASTPGIIVNHTIQKLKDDSFKSNINDLDYIKITTSSN